MSDFDLRGFRLANGKLAAFTSYGSYPLFYVTKDGGVLCAKCASEDGQTDDPHDPQWHIVGADAHWEGEPLICDHCNAEIESAYGVPDAEVSDGPG